MSCRVVRPNLHRDAEALTEADRLLLEDHVQACSACRGVRAQLVGVRELAQAVPLDPLTQQAHQRAISRALIGGAPSTPEPSLRAPMFAFAGAAIVALAIALYVVRTPGVENDAAAVSTEPTAVSGILVRDGAALPFGGHVPRDASIHVAARATVVSFDTRVVLAMHSVFRWTTDDALVLESGAADADASARRAFRVVTARFAVVANGTRFSVTPDRVSVAVGSLMIVAASGETLVPRLSAGETWTFTELAAAPLPGSGEVAPPAVKASALLERARRAFATNDCGSVRKLADAALDASPRRTELAEARTLLAECAQIEGRFDDAAAAYEAIASRFGDLPAGETALMALARLEVKRGNAGEARRTFERYLLRHPAGRFADDARRYLHRTSD